jgi:hypothetical protein
MDNQIVQAQLKDNSKERVAFDLMKLIDLNVAPPQVRTKKYYLDLYYESLKVVDGYEYNNIKLGD